MSGSADTIAAVATPPGKGGIGIVRVSGPDAQRIAERVTGSVPRHAQATYRKFKDACGDVIDSGYALFFAAPASFTGEDVVELHGHGGPVVMDLLLRTVVGYGARIARPGEFTQRAFLNDKIDLAQAEAVADLIEAASEQSARSAQRSLQGELSRRISALVEALIDLRVHVEAAIDFAEEEIDFLADSRIEQRLLAICDDLDALARSASQGYLLREGLHAVIAGEPNVGKSSLLNQLAGRDTAIVTEIPGTTRDIVREHIHIDGLPLHLLDTAGLRRTADVVEREGIERARTEMSLADLLILVVEGHEPLGDEAKRALDAVGAKCVCILVHNKIDLFAAAPRIDRSGEHDQVWLSAKTGAGVDLLVSCIKENAGYAGAEQGLFSARRRHLDALAEAADALAKAKHQLRGERAGELLAEDLRQAQRALATISGAFTSDDLLDRIFSSFCIGK